MVSLFLWYLLISLIGLISFPIAFTSLPFLADRGYSFTRIIGLLIWSYLFWLLTSLGILSNGLTGALFALFVLVIFSKFFSKSKIKDELRIWFKQQKRIVLFTELLFLFSFALWALVRSLAPEIQGTEKPMEMAFISSISRSPTFPPNDPWLSGYAISYYYFGYVMVALLGWVTGTSPSVSFNLAISAWFALTALGAFGIVYNLLRTWQDYSGSKLKSSTRHFSIYSSLLGPFFLLIVSNLEGFLEMLHAKGLFWNPGSDGTITSTFWKWLNIQELNQPPSPPLTLIPNRLGGIWWWRASRVLQDFDVTGVAKEIIDEFPFFSYYLGDLHPHVLAMPLGLLAIAIAMNLFRGQKEYALTSSIVAWIKKPIFWLAVLCCGGILFANTWDLPIYLGLILLTYLTIRIVKFGWSKSRIMEVGIAAIILACLSAAFFLPFLLGFSSQAGGLLPSLNFFTQGQNFWIMFFPFLFVILLFFFFRFGKITSRDFQIKPILIFLCLVLSLAVLSYGLAWVIGNLPNLILSVQSFIGKNGTGIAGNVQSLVNSFIGIHGGFPINMVIAESILNRLKSPLTLLTLIIIGGGCVLVFTSTLAEKNKKIQKNDEWYGLFPIISLIFIGALFCLIPEFFYLRDVFGTRMNTIFKFYFQTWIFWSLAAASAAIILWHHFSGWKRVFLRVSLITVVLICSAYPLFGLSDKVKGIEISTLTLDGSVFINKYDPNEYAAIQWLNKAPYGAVAEAVGGSYSGFARISTYTGLPAVLGWPGHEMQWRGGVKEIGSREGDIRLLYETAEWEAASEILTKYQIRYIYIGDLEKSTYQVNETKFIDRLNKVFSNSTSSIYEIQVES